MMRDHHFIVCVCVCVWTGNSKDSPMARHHFYHPERSLFDNENPVLPPPSFFLLFFFSFSPTPTLFFFFSFSFTFPLSSSSFYLLLFRKKKLDWGSILVFS